MSASYRTFVILAAIIALVVTSNLVAAPFDGISPEESALIANDPPFVQTALSLTNVPRRTGRATVLFNGQDLSGWDVWLRNADPKTTYLPDRPAPIGRNPRTQTVFTVVQEDGAPAIHVSGEPWGGLLTKKAYGNYHFHLQYKWDQRYSASMPRNNGILYHSRGPYGAFFGTWMSAVEFEIMPQATGMILMVGASRPGRGLDGIDWTLHGDVRVGQDRSTVVYPWRRYMPSGHLAAVKFPAFGVNPARDMERPVGEWNTLDLDVHGDHSIHVVNGVSVMAAENLSVRKPAGKIVPLTSGRIQLQSEAAETFFETSPSNPSPNCRGSCLELINNAKKRSCSLLLCSRSRLFDKGIC